MRTFEQEGINVQAYVGSLHQVSDSGPNADWQKWLGTALGELRPILDSCEKLGFDATFDFSADSKIAAFITTLRLNGHDVYLEPWPLKGSTHLYGNRFHCRELFYGRRHASRGRAKNSGGRSCCDRQGTYVGQDRLLRCDRDELRATRLGSSLIAC